MLNNPMQLIKEYQTFKNNFTGDPKAEVERLLTSGQLTQQQLNELQKMAYEFQKLLNQ